MSRGVGIWKGLAVVGVLALVGAFFVASPKARRQIGAATHLMTLRLEARSASPSVLREGGPIAWHVGTVDPRFGVDPETVEQAARRAVQLWQDAAGKRLFEYREGVGVAVNLVFDDRQADRRLMHTESAEIQAQRDEAKRAKAIVHRAVADCRKAQDRCQAHHAQVEAEVADYNSRVSSLNASGGGSPDEIAELNADRDRISAEQDQIQREETEVHGYEANANSLTDKYNDLVAKLNAHVLAYNNRFGGGKTIIVGECLQEVSGDRVVANREIRVYAFDDPGELARILAHEFGHALNVQHVPGDGSIMSAVEQGSQESKELKLSKKDRKALKTALERLEL